MALHKATQVASGLPVPTADRATDLVPIFGDFTIPASGFASADVVEMAGLPAGYVPVDVIIDHEDCGGTITGDVGVLTGEYGKAVDANGAARDCGAEFISAGDFGSAGVKRMNAAGGGRIAPVDYTRGVGFKFTTVTTPTAGAKIRFTLLCRPAIEGA